MPRRTRVLEHRPCYCRVVKHIWSSRPAPTHFSCLRKCRRDAAFEVIASTCRPHLRSLATLTPSSLKDVTRSTGAQLKVTDGGRSLATVPISISLVLRPFTIMPASVDCCTSSSTNDYMQLTCDWRRISVIVVSSTSDSRAATR